MGRPVPVRSRRRRPAAAVSVTVCTSSDEDEPAVPAAPTTINRKRPLAPSSDSDARSSEKQPKIVTNEVDDDESEDDSDFEPESASEAGDEDGSSAPDDDEVVLDSDDDADEDGSSAPDDDEVAFDSDDDDDDDDDNNKFGADWIVSDDDDSAEGSDDEIVAKSQAIDQEKAAEAADADAELRVNISAGAQEQFMLPSADDRQGDQQLLMAPDLTILKQRINQILFVLSDLKNQRQPGLSRADYLDRLQHDLALYYGYNTDLVAKFLAMLSPAECVEFLEANAAQRPICIRANTLKVRRRDLAQALINRGVNLDPLGDWTKVGLTITSSQVPIAATPEYLAGHYMLQSPSSFLPVMALAPKEHETVLDMCSAPGGKTTYLSALMKNTGCVIANDVNKERLKATVANAHRLGAQNVLVVNYDGRKLPEHFRAVDRVLLDAPCSGLGVISKDESIKLEKTTEDILKCAQLQKDLILAAIDMLKPNGTLVYSTCSISVEENESVVQSALRKRFVKIVPTGIEFGRDGFKSMAGRQFHPNMTLARRIYPHVHNMDGFFVAKLEKLQDGPRKRPAEAQEEADVCDSP